MSDPAKKYEIVAEDTIEVFGIKLFRIRSTRTFGIVEAGDLGGYVESEENLSQFGEAWVSGEARVSGKARVFGDWGANAQIWSDDLWATRQDMFSILDMAPAEVPALRAAMVEGRINGSVYTDGSGCGCLCGTIGIIRSGKTGDVAVNAALEEMGIHTSASRPAEMWFIKIEKGDEPLPLDTVEWPSESVFRLSRALQWLDEWIGSRSTIAEVLSGRPDEQADPGPEPEPMGA